MLETFEIESNLATRNLASLSLPAFGGLVRLGGLGFNSVVNIIELEIQIFYGGYLAFDLRPKFWALLLHASGDARKLHGNNMGMDERYKQCGIGSKPSRLKENLEGFG